MSPSSSVTQLKPDDHRLLMLLRMAPFVLRRNGWRFGAKRITDTVVNRLIDAGAAVREGNVVMLRMLQASGPLDSFAFAALPDGIGQAPHADGPDALRRAGRHLPILSDHDVAPDLSPDKTPMDALAGLGSL
jgi:hypothetical protein